ncbi:MAG: nuclear transport factor 2 family protein, partial [Mycobacterium sp.]
MTERFLACFAARDWDAFAEILADDISTEDRRRVVNAGIRQDRDAELKDFRSAADLGVTNATSGVIATRGERLVLIRSRLSRSDEEPEAFHVDLLWLVEIDADDRIAAWVTFDPDDFDAAIAELDARYLAGEAAAHARTWSVIAGAYAALNRHELPAATPDGVSMDHRRGAAFAPGELTAYIRAAWDNTPEARIHIEVVHRLCSLGAVVTEVAHGASLEGFDAEWRDIAVVTVDGGMISRGELFDEADLDTAIARFDQLSRPAPRLENAASQLIERFLAHFAARDWEAFAAMLADDTSSDDRRRLMGVGVRRGKDAVIGDWRATADVGVTNITSNVIATRGGRIALYRLSFSGRDRRSGAPRVEVLGIAEIDTDGRIAACVMVDLDEIDAAIEELDARYLAGQAVDHAHTWSVISQAYAALNRRALPATTPDWTSIDHRRFGTIEANALTPNIRAWWDLTSEARTDIETVHQLTTVGGVVTHTTHATSNEGLGIESREIVILMVEGDLLSRCEIFDETDLDAALARFEELHLPVRRLENAATQLTERFLAHFAAGDWDAMPEMMADNFSSDDRRRVVGAGVRHGRSAQIMDMRAIADLGIVNGTTTHIATRGGRLALSRTRMSGRDQQPGA